jgi:hypothetical protein
MPLLKEDASDDEADEVEFAMHPPVTKTVPHLPRAAKHDELLSFKVD